ncbi:MAG: DUF432 domain-containing protein [Archaeoglobaceae archaeon]|nr:DUF432 domain-containing protein [Archaeoglobaceae archaeon]MDW8128647.1 DUF432 domain-containing protein [Archaeoglobaceae archaeon]
MFGVYNLKDLSIKKGELDLKVEAENGFYSYIRKMGDSEVRKIILKDAEVCLNPVEPVNLPKNITNYLYIGFKNPVLIAPVSSAEVYTTFPIEIGVIIRRENVYEDIDVFSFVNPKFALYGEPRGGVIGRYWEGEVFGKIPQVDPLREGILKLTILNLSHNWCEVSKAVFDVYGMEIYYNEKVVSSIAEMRIHSKRVADTSFVDEPLLNNMKKSIGLYSAKLLPMLSTKFTMEWGV